MRKKDRLKIIMREINLHNKVLSTDLSALLNVSDDTIRRDLKELVDGDKVRKVHGGAISKSIVPSFIKNSDVYAQDAKQQIAAKLMGLLKNDMVIATEGGTTMIEVAKAIPDNLRITFFTISPQVAITLSEHEQLEVITIGGNLRKNANLHTGSSVINQLSDIKVDLCLLGANAFSMQDGLTDVDWEVVQAKKALIKSAKKVAVLTISEKLNTVQRIKICDPGQVTYLITELPADSQILTPYRSSDLQLI
jgi:DeoR/GlpR family transcriptional regulator of sugar metabolism